MSLAAHMPIAIAVVVFATIIVQVWAGTRVLTWRFLRRHLYAERNSRSPVEWREDFVGLLDTLKMDGKKNLAEDAVQRYRRALLDLMTDEFVCKSILRSQLLGHQVQIDPDKLSKVRAANWKDIEEFVDDIDHLKQDQNLIDQSATLKAWLVRPHIRGEVRQFDRILKNELSRNLERVEPQRLVG